MSEGPLWQITNHKDESVITKFGRINLELAELEAFVNAVFGDALCPSAKKRL